MIVKRYLLAVLCVLALSAASGQYLVNFEGPSEIKPAYASGTVSLSGLDWDLTEVLIGTSTTDFRNGDRSARLRGYGISALTMLQDKPGGLGSITFLYRRYGTDPQVDWLVQYSTDQGSTWNQAGEAFTAPATDEVQTFSATVNIAGNIRIRIKRATETGASNNRLNIDDIVLSDPVSTAALVLTGNLVPFTTAVGIPSAAQSYALAGTDLTSNIDVGVPSGFEISVDAGQTWQTSASLDPAFSGTVLVRMTGAMSGTFGGYLIHSSSGAASVSLPVVGTVTVETSYAEDLFISEYIEGSSYNKSLEIFNGTGSAVDLSDYRLELYSNGGTTPSSTQNLSGILAHSEVFVVSNSQANAAILAVTDLTSGVANFNGDDAVALRKISSNAQVDIFGVIGNDPGDAWTGDGAYTTLDRTLVRKAAVSSGVTVNPGGTGATAFTTLTTEWDLYAQDTFNWLGSHTFEGGGEAVDPPTLQSSSIVCYPTSTTIALEWTPGNGSRRVVKINSVNSFTVPADGTSPGVNPAWLGLGEQVIYNNSTQIVDDLPFNGCEVTGLTPNTTYWFRIYEYNGSGAYTSYLAIPASGNPASSTTLNSQGTGYYADIYGYGSTLKSNLNVLLKNTHTTQYSYSALITQIPYTDDDPGNPDNLVEIYTGWSVDKDAFGNEPADWNREHTWSKSHGDFGDVAPAGTDLHHLRPCDATVNSSKSNKDFDNGGSPVTDSSPPSGYSGATGCYSTSDTWEARPEDKGDVARMIMYMAVRYEGTDASYPVNLELVDYVYSDAGTNQPYYGKLSTLLQWHAQDLPDTREMQRNERIYQRQGNRNPFIDQPAYAQRIWSPCPLYASDVSITGFTAWWSTPITATDYFLQIATDSLFTNVLPGYDNLDVNLTTSRAISGLAPGGTYFFRLRSWFLSGYGMYSPFLAVTLIQPALPLAVLSSAQTLEEINLQGAALILALENTSFLDGTLAPGNFSLNNAPAGLYIQSVSYLDAATAQISLGFTGSDFDDNYGAFSLTIAASELTSAADLASSALAIIAHVEGLASIDLEGSLVRLAIVPITGAVSYRVFASEDPYTTFSEITTQGLFDPLYPNIWRVEAILSERRFYRVAAIRD